MSYQPGYLLYGQSGGPTSVINASAFGAISEAFKHPDLIKGIYGAHYGIDGIINDDLRLLDKEKDASALELLKQTPGAAFGSTRHKLKEYSEDPIPYEKILETFKKHSITGFMYNGGNDSMDTCEKLSRFFLQADYPCSVIGIPKTIDNDLVATDHCPGYGSAAKYIANAFACLKKDAVSYAKGRINIVEIMGRDTGWLAASASLAGLSDAAPDLIYVPEIPFSITDFLEEIKAIYEAKGSAFAVVSEGIRDNEGKFIADQGSVDAFGHPQLGGVGAYLASILAQGGYKTRAIELSLVQRSASFLTSKTDTEEAVRAGEEAVRAILNHENGKMIAFVRASQENYSLQYKCFPLKDIAAKVKYLPRSFMSEKGNNVSADFLQYALPLIEGENSVSYVSGLIQSADFIKS
jgi:6-phosphofructokinase